MNAFDHALDASLLARLAQADPISVAVTFREYSDHLLPLAKRSWSNPVLWDARERQRMLLFFRGYSFFRQLGENEREFWSNLHLELNFTGQVNNAQRDMLERTLKSDPRIREMFVEDTRREFVKTIDAIWGIRSLNAQNLERLFRRYFLQTKVLDVDAALIRELLKGLEGETVERAVRQSASYNRIFRGLREAIEFVYQSRIDPSDLATLSARMNAAGFVFSEPNPVEFFRNKAERALRNLFQHLRGELRVVAQSPKRIVLNPPEPSEPTVHRTVPKTRELEDFAVNVQYADSTHEFAEVIQLEFHQLPVGTRVLRLSGATVKDIAFTGSTPQFIIAPGTTHVQVFVDGEPATRPKTLFGLPPLKWRFWNQQGERLTARPVEGRSLTAEVQLEDGTFERVRWSARWDADGRHLLPSYVQFDFGEYRIEAALSAEAHAVRFLGSAAETLETVSETQTWLRVLPDSTQARQRFVTASRARETTLLDEGQRNVQVMPHETEVNDELIIERHVNGNFEAVGRIALRLKPQWHTATVRGTSLELLAFAPLGAVWRVRDGLRDVREYVVIPEVQFIALPDQRRASKRSIAVSLESGHDHLERTLEYTPDWGALIAAELPFGLGWGER